MKNSLLTPTHQITIVCLLCRLFRIPDNKPVKLKKHKMIAQAFAKRQALAAGGNMSITFCSTHDDPLGKKIYAKVNLK